MCSALRSPAMKKGQLSLFAATALVFTACLAAGYVFITHRGLMPFKSGTFRIQENAAEEVGELDDPKGHSQNPDPDSMLLQTPHIVPVQPIEPLGVNSSHLENMDRDGVLLLGRRRKGNGFLTIGIIYSSPPDGRSLLNRTLGSLLNGSREASDESSVTVVVLVSGLDPQSEQEARAAFSLFPDPMRAGLLQLIRAPASLYPKGWAGWRSKEQARACLESAFLLAYAADSTDYVLQLHPSAGRAVPGYAGAARDFVGRLADKYWVLLELAPGLAEPSGQLLRARSRDVRQLIFLLTEFSQHRTVAKSFTSFRVYNTQKTREKIATPLFKMW